MQAIKEVWKIPEKTLAIRVDEEFYKRLKLRLAENGLTMKDYFVSLVEEDMKLSAQEIHKDDPLSNILQQTKIIARLLEEIAKK